MQLVSRVLLPLVLKRYDGRSAKRGAWGRLRGKAVVTRYLVACTCGLTGLRLLPVTPKVSTILNILPEKRGDHIQLNA